jgi:hypothetical protein
MNKPKLTPQQVKRYSIRKFFIGEKGKRFSNFCLNAYLRCQNKELN